MRQNRSREKKKKPVKKHREGYTGERKKREKEKAKNNLPVKDNKKDEKSLEEFKKDFLKRFKGN